MNSIIQPSTIENNPRNYQQRFEYPTNNNSILDFSSRNSVDPSIPYTHQASFGYINRDYGGFEFEMRTRVIEELHSSEIRDGLRSTKCSSETHQNLLYFMYKKTHVVFFVFHFVQLYIFTL